MLEQLSWIPYLFAVVPGYLLLAQVHAQISQADGKRRYPDELIKHAI